MHYEFPYIDNIVDVLPAIEGRDEFRVFNKGPYTVINYMVNLIDSFPEVQTLNDALRRECRGIIFDSVTGAILRRPYHKFFNLNERLETLVENLNFSQAHSIITKLDGSMIVPFMLNDDFHFGTKLGVTEVSELPNKFAHERLNYMEFTSYCHNNGITPIFEWCSLKNRIVIKYPNDMLVLTAMRKTRAGTYIDIDVMNHYANKFCIPTLESLGKVDDPAQFIEKTAKLINEEGYVVRFVTGHMIKVKAEEYCQIHNAKDSLTREKNVLAMIFAEKVDDVLPLLPPEDRNAVLQFQDKVTHNALVFANELKGVVSILKDGYNTKKDFALRILQDDFKYKKYSGMLFKIFEGHNAFQLVQNYLLTHCGTATKVEDIRDIIRVTWNYGEINA